MKEQRHVNIGIIKPQADRQGILEAIVNEFGTDSVFEVATFLLTRAQAEAHYAEHRGKDFFDNLVTFMSSDPVTSFILVGDSDIIPKFRTFMSEVLRPTFGTSITANAIHGSDSPESAMREMLLWYGECGFAKMALEAQSYNNQSEVMNNG